MSNPYGYNLLSIPDKGAFLSHIRRLNPPALLFYGAELDFARQVHNEFPDMITIIRNWPDSELHKHVSPAVWITQHASQADGGLYLYTMNESGLSQEVIDWHIQVMNLAIQRGIHLCLLNPATGTWDNPDCPRLKPLLELAGKHRDLFIIGLHSYAGGVITSGLLGGYPVNAGVASSPNDAPGTKGRNLIPQSLWPKRDEILHTTTFHIGRHSWIMNYCHDNNIRMPRFALTETGFDYLGDIGAWLNTLDHSGFDSVNGWHTLRSQWAAWFGMSGEQAYFEQLKYAAENLLTGLEFALLYAYGDDGNWPNYNVANSGLPALLEGLNTLPPPPHEDTPPPDELDLSSLRALVADMKNDLMGAMGNLDGAYVTLKHIEDVLK